MHDNFGHDPSVLAMRRIFASLEKAQGELLTGLNISRFDGRLRRVRDRSRLMFDKAWAAAAGRGLVRGEADAPVVYLHCMARRSVKWGWRSPIPSCPRAMGSRRLFAR